MIEGIDHVGIAVHSIEEARKVYEAMELLEPLSEDSPVGKFLAKRGPGIHHLSFATDDVRSASDHLREGGFQVLRPEPTRGAGGCWVQFVHPKSTGGVLLELSQHGDEE